MSLCDCVIIANPLNVIVSERHQSFNTHGSPPAQPHSLVIDSPHPIRPSEAGCSRCDTRWKSGQIAIVFKSEGIVLGKMGFRITTWNGKNFKNIR